MFVHKLNAVITILRTWFRWDDAFELPSITVEGEPHKIIPTEIANKLHFTQFQLLKAVESEASRGRFSDPIIIRRKFLVPKYLLEFFELVGNTTIDLPLDLQNKLLKARQSFAHDKTNDYYNLCEK